MSSASDRNGTDESTRDGDSEAVDFEYEPTGTATTVAIGSALVAVVALATGWLSASVGAAVGTLVLAIALYRGSPRTLLGGATVLFGSLLAGAVAGMAVAPVLVGAVATVLAYDSGRYAIRLGQQIGADGQTAAAERRHVVVTASVSSVGAILGGGIFYLAPAEQPGFALVALLLAAVLLLSGLSIRVSDSGE